jgi:hypothetical protein
MRTSATTAPYEARFSVQISARQRTKPHLNALRWHQPPEHVLSQGELVGIIIPINQKLVAYIVEQNLSRVKRNVLQGELEYQSGAAQTLAEVLTAAAVPV